jgi:hypothetical protein
MFRAWLSPLFVVAAVAALPSPAEACSCLAQTPAQIYERADAAFVGEVIAIAETPRRKTVTLRIVHAYKGAVTAGETVTVTLPGGSSASCSLDFTAKARAVIFARATDGRLSTNLCQGSYQLEPRKPLPTLPPPV